MKLYFFIFLFFCSACGLKTVSSTSRHVQSSNETGPDVNTFSEDDTSFIDSVQLNQMQNESTMQQPETQTLQDKVCNLPPEAINPQYFEKFCKKNICLLSGSDCKNHRDCCSQKCSNRRCLADKNNKIPINRACQSPYDCISNICQRPPNLTYKICLGSQYPNTCSLFRDISASDSNCCSLRRINNRCIGSPLAPAQLGQFCYANHDECSTHYCNLQTHRCE